MTLDVFIMFIITLLLLRDGNWWKKHALQWLWANWKKKEKDKEEEHAFLPVAPALPGSTGLEGWAEGKISVPPTPERGLSCPVQAGCLLISYQLVNLKLEIQGLNVAHGLIICLLGLGTFLPVQ